VIRVQDRGPVRVVTLDRPDKRNALAVGMLGELARVFRDCGSARAMVLVGNGPVFCAGFDLFERADGDALAALRLQLEGLAKAIEAMRSGGVPVVIGVHGAAVAGGCALLGGGDIVVGERGVKVGYPVLRLGISPAVTGPFLRAAVGDGAMRSLLLDPTLIDGQRAHDLGLIHELVEDADAVGLRAVEVAQRLAEMPGDGVAATRQWLGVLEGKETGKQRRAALVASLDALDDETIKRLERQVWKR
jgi:methylglutaconyl-CoA hydratase